MASANSNPDLLSPSTLNKRIGKKISASLKSAKNIYSTSNLHGDNGGQAASTVFP